MPPDAMCWCPSFRRSCLTSISTLPVSKFLGAQNYSISTMPKKLEMRIDVISIFPEYFDVFDISLSGKARARGLIDLAVHDLREDTHDRHRTVDDKIGRASCRQKE